MKDKAKENRKNNPINIWYKDGFRMCGIGKKNQLLAIIKHFNRCLKWSKQRIERGYCDKDVWDMDWHLQRMIPDMLQQLRDNRDGSPGYLGRNYVNERGILVNDTCHEVWDELLDRMIFLWHESEEETCSQKNEYENEYLKALDEFGDKYGLFGEKLRTPEELEYDRLHHTTTAHFMGQDEKYRELYRNYWKRDREINQYMTECRQRAVNMLNTYFSDLCD